MSAAMQKLIVPLILLPLGACAAPEPPPDVPQPPEPPADMRAAGSSWARAVPGAAEDPAQAVNQRFAR